MASQHADVQPDVTGHEDTAAARTTSGTQDGAGHQGKKLEDVIAEQEKIFLAAAAGVGADGRPGSRLAGRRRHVELADHRPQAVWLSHGRGSKVYDVDGNEYVDLHGGYGAALAGHAHPAIVEAVQRPGRAAARTSPSRPRTRSSVAEELARRFGLPLWRFANSGTEATMDAVHLMRAITGRDLIIKVEGCYHGHHDSVQVSVCPEADEVGPGEPARPGPGQHRHPRAPSPS